MDLLIYDQIGSENIHVQTIIVKKIFRFFRKFCCRHSFTSIVMLLPFVSVAGAAVLQNSVL